MLPRLAHRAGESAVCAVSPRAKRRDGAGNAAGNCDSPSHGFASCRNRPGEGKALP